NKNAATYVEGGGVYCFDKDSLEGALRKQAMELPDGCGYGFSLAKTLRVLNDIGYRTQALCLVNREETINITDRIRLSQAGRIVRKRILEKLMLEGVTIIDPDSTYIDTGVKIGIDTQIFPGTIIKGGTVIGEQCTIGPNAVIYSSVIGNKVTVDSSEVRESSIGDSTKVGPFAYIRPASSIGSNVKIGDFVEIKKSQIGDDTKISHLTYVGDSEVGRNVNIGCGVVFVNYNGKEKNKCIVGDNAFIGCNTNLVAPVEVKNDSYIAAGSTITETVPEHSLAIARERQIIKDNWVIRKNMQRTPKEGDVK
ncbi:MAG: DapH/DapD/GlmU-related protein, partial [Eubacteriales bacterium]|nr:DapH/DapD/GlmU-related protein [Eubacteriales bacterium]